MIIIHAGLSSRQLCLWGEMPPEGEEEPTSGSTAVGEAPPLPYDASAEALAGVLAEAGVGTDATRAVLAGVG